MSRKENCHQSPATLVSIAVAARNAGDRNLERETAEKLRKRFGVRLVFTQKSEREVSTCK